MESIEPFINRKVVVLREDESISHVARAMRDNGIGMVLLVNQRGHVSGIITDRDITTRAVSELSIPQIPASQIMSKDLLAESTDSPLDRVIDLMKQHGVRRIPIFRTEKTGAKCVGVISLDDLIAARAISIEDISAIVRAQIRRRTRRAFAQAQIAPAAYENEIIDQISRRLSVSNERALIALQYLITGLVRRLHYTAAFSLVSLLPPEIQIEMSELTAGPDRRVDRSYLLQGLATRLKTNEEHAATMAEDIWSVLKSNLNLDRLQHVFDQLPKDIQQILTPVEELAGRAGQKRETKRAEKREFVEIAAAPPLA